MSGWAITRALFLIFLFPRIIDSGRNWYSARYPYSARLQAENDGSETDVHLPTNPEEIRGPVGTFAEEEPVSVEPAKASEETRFDLLFLRWSLVLDGFLTMLSALATAKWHIYLGILTIKISDTED
jgi:hypothetical protein